MEEAKKLKTVTCYDEECDQFSNLSDELVCHVLSFLPTKAAYRSSVLSKRWASICTTILDLNFEIPEVTDSSSEIKSVYAALLRRTENIRKLRLRNYDGCKPCDVHLWVSKALDLKVQELHLEFGSRPNPILPLRLFRSESLVVLKLRGHIEFQPTLDSSFDIHLPSLKILHLDLFRLDFNEDRSEYDLIELLSGCPRLEEFLFHGYLEQPINISFPLLKRLDLNLWRFSDSVSPIGPLQINIQSSLEALDFTDFSHKEYEFINLSNVDRATLSIIKYVDFNSLHKLLKGLSYVKSLTLTSETIKVSFNFVIIHFYFFLRNIVPYFHILLPICYFCLFVIQFLSMEDKLHNLSFLTFHKLLSLSVGISENCNWNLLVGFLQNAPNLKDLIIEVRIKYYNSICTKYMFFQ
ncbi:putative F-box domain, leucine-rich repeat domain, L domain-containing protein [Medicago truncatula]|nr:putative F-box domain, leucine-rich repeat domain, L domain-containing protein [Medicago truncatula]